MSLTPTNEILFHYKSSVKVGELERYVITYHLYDGEEIPPDLNLNSLWLKVRNMNPLSYRAAYLMGPFMLYCDVKTAEYHHSQKIVASVDYPKFEPNVQTQQDFVAELSVHNIRQKYVWIADVMSQILFTTNTNVTYEVTIGTSKESVENPHDLPPHLGSYSPKLTVNRLATLDLWNLPVQITTPQKKKHLVVLTHGLHSNVSTDLVYIMEQIYKAQKNYPHEQIVVKGYRGNVCQTEKGVKYLGTRLAEYIIQDLYDESIRKISFVGHSLGGLIQAFAIAYIYEVYPWFFKKVNPINFITLASPLLGIVTDNPAYIKVLLSFGVIGKTGQDLGLENDVEVGKPLLYLLSGLPLIEILRRFKRRTVYANAINDGIVPLYTASLLFLDYNDILEQLQKLKENSKKSPLINDASTPVNQDFFNKTFISPLTKMLSILAPQKFPTENGSEIPKVSFFESASSILLPPLPERAYIMDPDSRDPVIIHDKIYNEDDIPQSEFDIEDGFFDKKSILLQAFFAGKKERAKYRNLEETIARRWHEGMAWRKVVVALKPDAHNNIIVRRKFANAYGWPVIDHLIDVHFNGDDDDDNDENDDINSTQVVEPIQSVTEGKKKYRKAENIPQEYGWLNKVETNGVFDEGPTGMISTVGEIVEALAKRGFSAVIDRRNASEDPNDEVLRFEEMNSDLVQ